MLELHPHNPVVNDKEWFKFGNRIKISDVSQNNLFVRVEIEGSEITIYIQLSYVIVRNEDR